jgi:hypothetical protein
VALVLHHHYNGLDEAGAVAGLVAFLSALRHLPVVLLRCDVSGSRRTLHQILASTAGGAPHDRRLAMPPCQHAG